MFYKIRNILCLTVLALLLVQTNITKLYAQGVVTLADNAENEDPALNQDIPDEIALFDDSIESEVPSEVPAEAGNAAPSTPDSVKTPKEKQTPAETVVEENISVEDIIAAAPAEQTSTPLVSADVLNQPGSLGILGQRSSAPKNITEIDDRVFSQMSELEKQTALLNLELRREKVKNEIEAIKNQRKEALEKEKEKEEAKRKARIEWEKAQEQKVVQEQQKLRELDIAFEKLRQEKLLNSYKNKMLEINQQWIKKNAALYEQMDKIKKEKQEVIDDAKLKFASIKNSVANASNQVKAAKEVLLRQVADLQTQISILKARIEAQEREMEKQNPFAEGGAEGAAGVAQAGVAAPEVVTPELKLNDMYAVMEIRGQGGELIAKLINQDGSPFYVKKGTTLQSGHVIDEITTTYVRAEKAGAKDYLYFAAGGILPLEPQKSELEANLKDELKKKADGKKDETPKRDFIASEEVPGMGRDMIVR